MPRSTAIKIFCFFFLFLDGISLHTASAGEYPKTAEEFARLPPFCLARMRQMNEPQGEQWARQLGSCWIHLHHYCAGLNSLNEALAMYNKKQRNEILQKPVIGNFNYMWEHAGPGCALMPEILVNKGKALVMIDKTYEALESYRKAIELNQRYIPAYAELAALYGRTGQTDAARTILEYALKVDPKSRLIQRKLAELGGRSKSSPPKAETNR